MLLPESLNPPIIGSKYICLCVILMILALPVIQRPVQSYLNSIRKPVTTQRATQVANTMSPLNSPARPPVYFLGIGGPNFIENTKHPAYIQLAEVGKEITTKVNPKAVVVISAHWQNSPSKISVNVAEKTDLIYDFYNFPPHYYEYEYSNNGSPEIAEIVIQKLGAVGIEVDKVKRGLDHGVWVGFLAGR